MQAEEKVGAMGTGFPGAQPATGSGLCGDPSSVAEAQNPRPGQYTPILPQTG